MSLDLKNFESFIKAQNNFAPNNSITKFKKLKKQYSPKKPKFKTIANFKHKLEKDEKKDEVSP